MNSTLTLSAATANANTVNTNAKKTTAAQIVRSLNSKTEMFAVVGLMVSSAVYGVYALTQMTGF